jgi:DNA-binding response OmpR family regulator
MDDYIAKPFNPSDLVAVIERWTLRVGQTPPADAAGATPPPALPSPAPDPAPSAEHDDAQK